MRPIEIFDELVKHQLTLEQAVLITDVMVKQASRPQAKRAVASAKDLVKDILSGTGGFVNTLSNAGSLGFQGLNTAVNAASTAAPWAVLATAGPGYMIGKGVANALDVDKSDITEIQEEELIEELTANAERLRKQKELMRS